MMKKNTISMWNGNVCDCYVGCMLINRRKKKMNMKEMGLC